MIEAKSSAHIDTKKFNFHFAEAHNKRHFYQTDGIVASPENNIYLNFVDDSYYKKVTKTFNVKGTSDKKTVSFDGLNYEKIFDNIKQLHTKATGKKWEQRKGPKVGIDEIFKEMVVNCKSTTTKEDLLKLNDALKDYGITPLTIDLHKEEGHFLDDLDENGNRVIDYNFHAHIIFADVNETGKYMRRGKKELSKLQDIVAEVLQMERGERGSKTKRLSAQQFKRKALEETELNNKLLSENVDLTKKVNENNIKIDNLESENKDLKTQIFSKSKLLELAASSTVSLENTNKSLKNDNEKLRNKVSFLDAIFKFLGLDTIKYTDPKEAKKELKKILNEEQSENIKKIKEQGIHTQQQYEIIKTELNKRVVDIENLANTLKDYDANYSNNEIQIDRTERQRTITR